MSTLKVEKPAQLNGKNVKMTYGIPISEGVVIFAPNEIDEKHI